MIHISQKPYIFWISKWFEWHYIKFLSTSILQRNIHIQYRKHNKKQVQNIFRFIPGLFIIFYL